MKKMMLGIVWQVLGFFGAIILLCTATTYEWADDVIGGLLGYGLLLPLIICIVLFILGAIICVRGIKEDETRLSKDRDN